MRCERSWLGTHSMHRLLQHAGQKMSRLLCRCAAQVAPTEMPRSARSPWISSALRAPGALRGAAAWPAGTRPRRCTLKHGAQRPPQMSHPPEGCAEWLRPQDPQMKLSAASICQKATRERAKEGVQGVSRVEQGCWAAGKGGLLQVRKPGWPNTARHFNRARLNARKRKAVSYCLGPLCRT